VVVLFWPIQKIEQIHILFSTNHLLYTFFSIVNSKGFDLINAHGSGTCDQREKKHRKTPNEMESHHNQQSVEQNSAENDG
jgi:hypothetical protein